MYRWTGSHFYDWIDYNGVAFSTELLEWGRTFSDFLGVRPFFIFTVSKRTSMSVLQIKSKVFFIQSKKWVNSSKKKATRLGLRKLHICAKVTKMGSIISYRIDYNGVRALRGQRHIPSKN